MGSTGGACTWRADILDISSAPPLLVKRWGGCTPGCRNWHCNQHPALHKPKADRQEPLAHPRGKEGRKGKDLHRVPTLTPFALWTRQMVWACLPSVHRICSGAQWRHALSCTSAWGAGRPLRDTVFFHAPFRDGPRLVRAGVSLPQLTSANPLM